MDIAIPWCWFEETSSDVEKDVRKKRQKLREGQGQKLYCHHCRHYITERTMGIAFNGNHVHTCTNPAGITYNFACYREAPGCAAVGTPTSEYSWFSGYLWQIALCSCCGEHLGWRFRGSEEFYGLVLGRLVDDVS